jgi:hypothetical protein
MREISQLGARVASARRDVGGTLASKGQMTCAALEHKSTVDAIDPAG